MSIIDQLVTDRAQADVEALAALSALGWDDMTPEQKAAWSASKGAYNASDLNRVGEACAYLYGVFTKELGTLVPGYAELQTDWTIEDIPPASYWTTYLGTVAALKAVWNTAQEIPETMARLGADGANDIEKALAEIDQLQKNTKQSWVYSGMVYSGQLWG